MLILCFASIPTALTGTVQSASGLYVLRLFIGVAGGSLVVNQYWTSRMFSKEVVGTANALVAGWGNIGGGVTQLLVGSALFPLFKIIYSGDDDKAWRTVCVVPAVVAFTTGVLVYFNSDDSPKGNYNELKKHGNLPPVSAVASLRTGFFNLSSLVLLLQYGCCDGVGLTMDNATALYFADKFGLSTASAAAVASSFGWMNVFARPLGGFLSDKLNARFGVRGRLWIQASFLAIEGGLVLIFATTDTLAVAIVVMIFFSIFEQGASGTTFSIVPYIDPPNTGSISGVVGAGASIGAVGFGFVFRQLSYKNAFTTMGATILGAAALTALVNIKSPDLMATLASWQTCDAKSAKEELETDE
jgi:NNP family nitrate/nitrite transporter-like MFS transporter